SLNMFQVDFIMVPNYDGGMENWGHILLSENLATSGDDAHLTYIIAHELAHHWIGDKATVNSWRWICLQEDLTDYIAYKVAAAVMGHDQRWERFLLSKYVAIQLTEDFFAPEHSLMMPDNVTQNLISSHCYLKGVVLLETLESVVGEEYMLAVIRNLVATKPTFDLKSFLFYFEDIPVDRNVSLSQVYEFWFLNGGFPALEVSSASLGFELHQLGPFPWPLRITSSHSLPPFLFAQTLTLPPRSSPTLVNVNFTSFMRVNYDSTTWVNIFSHMDEHPEHFSAVGRAQLVTDFCYFYAHDEVDGGTAVKELVLDTVYRNPEYFELCDWHLFWCHSTAPATLPQLLRRVALGVTRLFNSDDAFGCRTGMAARNLNAICNSVFSTRCV
uniref:Peptidase_M1 domain-containing protein n=1 Tax=Haemonchus contortus TaxID=6289 RepID=A0A7I4YH82_HAECO